MFQFDSQLLLANARHVPKLPSFCSLSPSLCVSISIFDFGFVLGFVFYFLDKGILRNLRKCPFLYAFKCSCCVCVGVRVCVVFLNVCVCCCLFFFLLAEARQVLCQFIHRPQFWALWTQAVVAHYMCACECVSVCVSVSVCTCCCQCQICISASLPRPACIFVASFDSIRNASFR